MLVWCECIFNHDISLINILYSCIYALTFNIANSKHFQMIPSSFGKLHFLGKLSNCFTLKYFEKCACFLKYKTVSRLIATLE